MNLCNGRIPFAAKVSESEYNKVQLCFGLAKGKSRPAEDFVRRVSDVHACRIESFADGIHALVGPRGHPSPDRNLYRVAGFRCARLLEVFCLVLGAYLAHENGEAQAQ